MRARTALAGYMGSYMQSIMCVRCVRTRARVEFELAEFSRLMTDRPCEICGNPNSPFGCGPPAQIRREQC